MRPRLIAIAASPLLTGCHEEFSTFQHAGPQGSALTRLSIVLIVAGMAVWIIVMIVMLRAAHRRAGGADDVDLSPRSHRPVIIGGAVLPTVMLIALFVTSIVLISPVGARDARTIIVYRVTGHQWWWDVQYLGPDGSTFRAPNELHVPVGTPVELMLVGADVIHSFWVPALQGKLDLVPGDTNILRFVVTDTGSYRGECAEYCGLQHAHMQLSVVAQTGPAFQQWLRAQRATADTSSASAAVGASLITARGCGSCHTVRGTAADGVVGPDLTHVASRMYLGSGILINNARNLDAWIDDAPAIKPGTTMPSFRQLPERDRAAITSYLRTLQ